MKSVPPGVAGGLITERIHSTTANEIWSTQEQNQDSHLRYCPPDSKDSARRRGINLVWHAGIQSKRQTVRAPASGRRVVGYWRRFRSARRDDKRRAGKVLHNRSLFELSVDAGAAFEGPPR